MHVFVNLRGANTGLVEAAKNATATPVITSTKRIVEVVKGSTYAVSFAKNSSELSNETKAVLDKIPSGSVVNVVGSTSPEGTVKRNTELANERAEAVKQYLENRGVTVKSAVGGEAGRAAIITVE